MAFFAFSKKKRLNFVYSGAAPLAPCSLSVPLATWAADGAHRPQETGQSETKAGVWQLAVLAVALQEGLSKQSPLPTIGNN